MALLPQTLLIFTLFVFALAYPIALAHDYSILGYSPEDLSSDEKLYDLFESWASRNQKSYHNHEEKLHRFKVFKDNMKYIDERNKQISGFWLGPTVFTDLTLEEFKNMYLGLRTVDMKRLWKKASHNFTHGHVKQIPSYVDWRDYGAVSSVKNQGQCGSCWAFASSAATESIYYLKTGQLLDLSAQQVLDCTAGDNTCKYGFLHQAYETIIRINGIHLWSDYPYVGYKQAQCLNFDRPKATITGYNAVPQNNRNSLLQAISQQPIAMSISAYSQDFQFYRGGVFKGYCTTNTDHFLLGIGYGTSQYGENYVLLKNSWGTNWGEGGFMRILMDNGYPQGLCGMYSWSLYPTKNN